MVGMSVVAVLRRTIAVPSATVTRAVIDSILITILLRSIRSVSAVPSIAASSPAAAIIPISIAISVAAPAAIVVAAVLPEAALVS